MPHAQANYRPPKASPTKFAGIVAGFIVLVIVVGGIVVVSTENKASGNLFRETRDLERITSITAGNSINIVYAQGPVQEVSVRAEDDLVPQIITTVSEDGELVIERESAGFSFWELVPTKEITVFITTKPLKSIALQESASFTAEDDVNFEDLDITMSESSELTLSGKFANITAKLSGSATLSMTGSAGSATFDVSESGEVEAGDLAAKSVVVNVSGAGNLLVAATEKITSEVSGSGLVVYKGNPPEVVENVSGAGVSESFQENQGEDEEVGDQEETSDTEETP